MRQIVLREKRHLANAVKHLRHRLAPCFGVKTIMRQFFINQGDLLAGWLAEIALFQNAVPTQTCACALRKMMNTVALFAGLMGDLFYIVQRGQKFGTGGFGLFGKALILLAQTRKTGVANKLIAARLKHGCLKIAAMWRWLKMVFHAILVVVNQQHIGLRRLFSCTNCCHAAQ